MILTSIDMGTNSIRLLISEAKDSELFDIVRKVKITRLGEGMDETRLISKEAMNRTLNVLKEYKEIIDKYKISNFKIHQIIGLGGKISAIASIKLGLKNYFT